MSKKKNTETAAGTPAAENMVSSLFTTELPAGAERVSQPPLIHLNEINVGSIISGSIVGVVESPVSTVKSKLLHLRHDSGTEFRLPLSGSLRKALPADEKELAKMTGKKLFVKRLPDRKQAGGKVQFEFDVYTVDK